MPTCFVITVRFLAESFHGRGEDGEPEWPPSPLRVYQALVSAEARHFGSRFHELAASPLRWLETLPPPLVVGPRGSAAAPYCLSVPNNAMDIVAAAWSRGNYTNQGDANPATHRTMKMVSPYRVGSDPVHFVWTLPAAADDAMLGYIETLQLLGRRLTVLGWGIDPVVAEAQVLDVDATDGLTGERWIPTSAGAGVTRRAPVSGTFDDLESRHAAFLTRVPSPEMFVPPPPLRVFQEAHYLRADEVAPRAVAAFQLLKPDASGHAAFDTPRRALRLVGMLRHAVQVAARDGGWSEEKIARFVLGHGEARGEQHRPVRAGRFAFLPLPSIEYRGRGKSHAVGAVRRLLITCLGNEGAAEVVWARRALGASELVDESTGAARALCR